MDTKLKHYSGTKHVLAMPMTKGEAYQKGICRLQFNDEQERDAFIQSEDFKAPGYKVVYQDGYESWSPKATFESAYLMAETLMDRLNNEIVELRIKEERLGTFICHSENYKELPLGTRTMLIAQLYAMNSYDTLLSCRQKSMKTGKECCPQNLSFEQILPLLKEGYVVRRAGWNGKGLMVFRQVPAYISAEVIPNMQSLPNEAKRLILAHGDHIDYVSQCLIFNPVLGEANSWVPSISDVFANDWELVQK